MRAVTTAALLAGVALALAPSGLARTERPVEQPAEPFGARVVGDGLIVPGQRVGPLRLAMGIEQILRLMPAGFRREVFPRQHIILYEWQPQGIWVSLDERRGTVRLLSAFGSGGYATDRGVALLATEAKMREVYGRETRRYDYPEDRITLVRYVSLGLQVGLVNQPSNTVLHGRIFTLGVFTPGREPPLAKTPAGAP